MAAPLNPTRMELTRLKKRLATAVRGHKLLKDKRDEMVRRFMQLIRRNVELRREVELALGVAFGSFAVARAKMGEEALAEAMLYPAREAAIEVSSQNIMSVDVPVIRFAGDLDTQADLPYGFAFTAFELDRSVMELSAVLPALLELASVEKTCSRLADEIEKTRRRVNALEYVLIPEMQQSVRYITMKLDENERGNLSRLMKMKQLMAQQEERS